MERILERAENFLPRVDEGGAGNEVDRRVVSLTAPASGAAEQYRTLYYRLERMRELRPLKVVALTSALPGEGKTLTAVNLALTASRANPDRRILLMDADLRRSQVAQVLGVKGRPGLSDLLLGDCQPGESTRKFRSHRLAVMPAGTVPEEPTQLLASPRMKEVLRQIREGFDEVYLDLPPSLPFADAAILGGQADGVMLVVRANVTSRIRVSQAMESLSGAPVVGCILNGASTSATPYLKAYSK